MELELFLSPESVKLGSINRKEISPIDIMSILWRSKAIIINRLIYRRTMTTGLVARNNIDITVL
jgi:hypothetical protein